MELRLGIAVGGEEEVGGMPLGLEASLDRPKGRIFMHGKEGGGMWMMWV